MIVTRPSLWPIEKLFIGYATVMMCLLSLAARNNSFAFVLIAAHAAAVGAMFLFARSSSRFIVFLRHWFLLAYVPFCYKEVPFMVSALGLTPADSTLARWDRIMWGGVDPVFWLSGFSNRYAVELLQLVYTLFIPGAVTLGIALWLYKSKTEFRYGAFVIAITFLISYLGYLILPARGPRFMEEAVQHPLHGLWFFDFFQHTLDTMEGKQYDCFPSGHVAVVLAGCFLARTISRRFFYIFSAFAALITISTIYLRYHYVIDVIVGVIVALLIVAFGPRLYRRLESANTA